MLSRDEIEKRLQDVPPELCAAFAVRSALRVLPLLAVEKSGQPPFWYWPSQDRGKRFLAVLNSLQVGRIISVVRLDGFHTAADDTRAAADAARATDDDARAYTRATAARAYAIAYARAAARAKTRTAARVKARAAADARAAYNDALLEDLDIIGACSPSGPLPRILGKSQQKQVTSAIELFQRPLWPVAGLPILIRPEWQLLRRWAESLESGFEFWFDWYPDEVDSKPQGELSEEQVIKVLQSKHVEDEHGNKLNYPLKKWQHLKNCNKSTNFWKAPVVLPRSRKKNSAVG